MGEYSNQKILRHKSVGINTNSVFCSLCGTNNYIVFSGGDNEVKFPDGFVPNFYPAMGMFKAVGENVNGALMGDTEIVKMTEKESNFKPNFQAPVPYGFYFPMLPLAYSPFCVPIPRRCNQGGILEQKQDVSEEEKSNYSDVHAQESCLSSVSEESKTYENAKSEKSEVEKVDETRNERCIDTNLEWDSKDEAIGCLKPPSFSCTEMSKGRSETKFNDRNSDERTEVVVLHKMEPMLESEEDITNKPKDEVKTRKSRFQTLTTTNKPIPNEEEQKKAQTFIRDIIEQMKDKPEPQKVCHTILKSYQEKTKDFLQIKIKIPDDRKNSEDKKFKPGSKDAAQEKNVLSKDLIRPKSKNKPPLPPKDMKPNINTRRVKKISDDVKKNWAI